MFSPSHSVKLFLCQSPVDMRRSFRGLASLWKVEDRSTQELMKRFYTNLWVKKMNKVDALHEAQLWLLKHPDELETMGVNNPRTRGTVRDSPKTKKGDKASRRSDRTSPFFWAAFQLSGDWQ